MSSADVEHEKFRRRRRRVIVFRAKFQLFFLLVALQKYASDTRTSSSSTSLSLYINIYFFLSAPFHSRSIARQFATKHFFFISNVGKNYRIECSTQIWLRFRFDFSFCCLILYSYFISKKSTHHQSRIAYGLHRDGGHSQQYSFYFFIFQFIIQNKTTKMPLLLIIQKKTSNISLLYMFIYVLGIE